MKKIVTDTAVLAVSVLVLAQVALAESKDRTKCKEQLNKIVVYTGQVNLILGKSMGATQMVKDHAPADQINKLEQKNNLEKGKIDGEIAGFVKEFENTCIIP